MTTLASRVASVEPHYNHASAEAYASFLDGYLSTPESIKSYLGLRDRFVHAYPDLHAWFDAPLCERVGRRYSEAKAQANYRVSYKARPYLIFLALQGSVQFDWAWLIAVPRLEIFGPLAHLGRASGLAGLVEDATRLGYNSRSAEEALRWIVSRMILRTGGRGIDTLTDEHHSELREAIRHFAHRPDLPDFFGSIERYRLEAKSFGTNAHLLHVVLYHRGQFNREPRKVMPLYAERAILKPQMEAIKARYLATRSLTDRPATVVRIEVVLRHFITWIAQAHPSIESFAEVTRDHALAFLEHLNTMLGPRTGRSLSPFTKRGYVSPLVAFFQSIVAWEWDNIPSRPLLNAADIPKRPERIPRYIPTDELERLMQAIRVLTCPYQRAALLIARWSGARRDEIRRQAFDCLDHYPDGTPRLRIPVGKTKRERMIPLNEEAAAAIRSIQAGRYGDRGFCDPYTGLETRYLFLHRGRLFSCYYLFERSVQIVCQVAGLVTPEGKPTISMHRFRHTVGTQLAEQGAKLHTIMSVLGHTSPSMSLVYAQISDKAVLKEYQAVLGPGATIAGPAAEILRAGDLSAEAVDWLKSNFLKTELELGHCLRLPQEGPCECDLYLTCAKFVTTPAYAPRLRERRQVEVGLIADAQSRGWTREVERHQRIIQRIEQLLVALGESLE